MKMNELELDNKIKELAKLKYHNYEFKKAGLEDNLVVIDPESRVQLSLEQKIIKWFRHISKIEYNLGEIFDEIDKSSLLITAQQYGAIIGDSKYIFLLAKEKELLQFSEKLLPEKHYFEAKRCIYNLICEFKWKYINTNIESANLIIDDLEKCTKELDSTIDLEQDIQDFFIDASVRYDILLGVFQLILELNFKNSKGELKAYYEKEEFKAETFNYILAEDYFNSTIKYLAQQVVGNINDSKAEV